jgi:hypothetical protein
VAWLRVAERGVAKNGGAWLRMAVGGVAKSGGTWSSYE